MRAHRAVTWCIIVSGIVATVGVTYTTTRAEREVVLIASRDTWVSACRGETDGNTGKCNRLKLKGIQEMTLVDFDASALRGWTVASAELWMHSIRSVRELKRLGLPLDRYDALRKIGISTVASEWVEGESARAYQRDTVGHGACFDMASYGKRFWAWRGSKLYDVIMGNGHTLEHHSELVRMRDGWWKVPVAPDLVHALIAGVTCGFCVMDESGQTMANNFVHSREAGKEFAPRLVVHLKRRDMIPPSPPKGIRTAPAPEKSTLTTGAVAITFTVPKEAFAYFIRINGEMIPRWQIPFASAPGERQRIVIEDLPPSTPLEIEIWCVDRAGNASRRIIVRGRSSRALTRPPNLPKSSFAPRGAELKIHAGRLRVWAFPAISKVDPLTGKLMFEGNDGFSYQRANAIWDGTAHLIRLTAARNEFTAFQLAIERCAGRLTNVRIDVSELVGERSKIERSCIRLYRAWYVRENGWQAEYAIPLRGAFSIPMDDNGISEQRVQAIWCDIYVPHDVPAGWYRGTVTVHADGIAPISLNLRVRVYDVTLPDELNFNPELNCYYSGSGWFKPGSEKWFAAHKLAHAHRCTINRVPYSQSGHVDASVAPKVVGDGVNQRVADWSEFDNCVGPLLNGSAFATNPRKGVPVKVMYLPFHENYPNPIAKHYRYRGEQYGQRCIILHALFAPPIERAFTREYMDGFRSIVRDFAEHFARMGWTRTIFQCYLNNKYRYRIMGRGTSWWLLDEPASYDDWMALRFFSRMFHEALVGQSTGLMRKHTTLLYKGVQFAFRGDISRPEWQFKRMDGLMEMMYVNNSIFTKVRRCRIMKERMPTILCVYGSCNRVGENNFQTVAWCLKAFIAGADGVLPWQSLAGDSAFFNADQCGLLVDGERFGEHVIASFRVKALRRGAELVELLRMLMQERKWTRDQIGALVGQVIPLEADFRQQFHDEATALQFGTLNSKAFEMLHEGALMLATQM